jgi:hypothetical protein
VHRVITLLEAAVGQLHHQERPAQRTLIKATSLLQQRIDPPAAGEIPDGRGRLLAWQARKVRDYSDSHLTGSAGSDSRRLETRTQNAGLWKQRGELIKRRRACQASRVETIGKHDD